MKYLYKSVKIGIFLFVAFVITMVSLYTYSYLSPKIDLKSAGNFIMYDNNEEIIYQGSKTSEWISIDEISDNLINATISVEDKNFYSHQGFDYLRIASAILNNIKSGSLSEGGSTITQQYAKNMYLNFDKTWERKIEEAFITLELEVHYDKDDILEGYLNTIYYGEGNYGIQNASKYYFNKDASELTLEESIILAGIPNRPTSYNPITNYDDCIERAKIVAKTMVNNEYISEDDYNNLFNETIEIYGKHTSNNLQMIMYYQDAVLNELEELNIVPTSLIESGGIKIYTTLDIGAQTSLEENILEYSINDGEQVAAAAIDPNTGAVIALTGGMDYSLSTYNRALTSERQVGSTMKPFLYYAALENNMTMASTFTSEQTVFSLSNDVMYSPGNFNGSYANKDITMAAAVSFSDNIYAVKTNLFLGIDKLINTAKKTGIQGDLEEVASLALGTSELNLLDLLTGYTTFASGGYLREPYFITKIEDMEGNLLYEKEIINNLVLNPNYTFILNEILTTTTSDLYSDYTNATALDLSNKLTGTYAFKSGTTDNDNLSIGYNPDLLVGVWMGYDEGKNTNTSLSRAAKNIWADSMEDILFEQEKIWYQKPDNVVGLLLDPVTGGLPTNADKADVFYFLKGTEPGASSFVTSNP